MTSDLIIQPGRVKRVSAGSLVNVPYVSTDDELAPTDLTGLRYRIDNLSDGRVVQEWTTVNTPGQNGTITIPASVNTMLQSWRRRQLNKVTLEQTTTEGVRQVEFFYELCAVLVGATA